MVPASGSKVGKNSRLKINAAAVPYRKKSYHSIAVPMKLATATCTIEVLCPRSFLSSLCTLCLISVLLNTENLPPNPIRGRERVQRWRESTMREAIMATGLEFPEGPVCGRDGSLYFVEVRGWWVPTVGRDGR